jgi:hypothetical protein
MCPSCGEECVSVREEGGVEDMRNQFVLDEVQEGTFPCTIWSDLRDGMTTRSELQREHNQEVTDQCDATALVDAHVHIAKQWLCNLRRRRCG